MSRFRRIITGILAVLVALPASASRVPMVAFTDVTVIPMDGTKPARGQTVVTANGRIESVSPAASTKVPEGALVVDGKGKYLLPGLAEMHGHIPPPTAPAEDIEAVLFLYLANGITTVRGMLGHDGQLELRAKAESGAIDSPTLYLAGPSFNGNSVSSPEQAAEMVRAQKKAGWDLLKVHPGLTKDEYDAMARTAAEVGITFGGHIPQEVGLLHALERKQETIDHLDGYIEHLEGDKPLPDSAFDDVAKRSKKAGVWVVPTMALWETLYGAPTLESLQSYPELKYVSKASVEQWSRLHEDRQANIPKEAAKAVLSNRLNLLGALDRAGVKILMGTDAPQQFSVPGFSLHRELKLMSAAGMSNEAILASGTRNVGEYFAKRDSFGTIAAGRRADVLLVDGNPLDDLDHLSRISGVMARGRWYPKSTIDERLAEIEERKR